ncbi:RING finger and CHY zinc finger domain-containing protein 1-like [Mizuhopecten yessoensis]|nr:RING finger and CHY zinc finger domain-containing protein 1-like [Mizuhopecten yessoensis]
MEETEESAPTVGCQHYKRKCALVSPCCKKVYTCRVCHDDEENHQLMRQEVQEVKCLLCEKVQKVAETCENENCLTVFGTYFCEKCRLYDDDNKKQFHCDKCGLCRVGGEENYFHCDTCGVCLAKELKNAHKCIEQASRSNCAICLEDLHTSRIAAHIPPCGHLIHYACFKEMLKTGNYACPTCNQSMVKMDNVWEHIDDEIAHTPMPEEYKDYIVQILCRDCHKESSILFHVLGLKCQECGSYNTCRTAGPEDAQQEDDKKPSNTDGSGDSASASNNPTTS